MAARVLLVQLIDVIVAAFERLRIGHLIDGGIGESRTIYYAVRGLVEQFRLLLRGQDTLVDPARDIAACIIILRDFAVNCELATLSAFASRLT